MYNALVVQPAETNKGAIKMQENTRTKETENGTEVAGQDERLVILPEYVEPEHRKLIEKAEEMLTEYESFLLKKIKDELFEYGWTIEPHPDAIRDAERQYHEDKVREHLLKQIANLRTL